MIVTLPVKLPLAASSAQIPRYADSSAAAHEVVQENASSATEGRVAQECAAVSATESKKSAGLTDAAARHSRWVAEPTSAEEVPSEQGGGLREEIRRKAEEALLAAAASKVEAAVVAQVAVPSGSADLSSASTASSLTTASEFSAAAQFQGRRSGFVFRSGESGVGYYRDSRQPQTVTEPQSAPAGQQLSAAVSSDLLPFTVEARQTSHALALLVQVALIVRSSVVVEFAQFTVDVYFRAAASEPGSEGDQCAVRAYGLRVQLDPALCQGGLDAEASTVDVAGGNMALVLAKRREDCVWGGGALQGDDALFSLGAYAGSAAAAGSRSASVETSTTIHSQAPATEAKAATTTSLASAMQGMQFSSGSTLLDLD